MPIARVATAPRVRRKNRYPEHSWNVKAKPYQITPFLIAPVLAGETLKNILWQTRAVTDPVKSPLVGWWFEQYFFYVRLAELAGAADYLPMLINPGHVLAAGNKDGSAVVEHMYASSISLNSVNYLGRALTRIVNDWFRDENDVASDFMINNLPAAKIKNRGIHDSLSTEAEEAAVDFDVDGPDANTTIQASEIEAAMRRYEMARMNGLTELTYEEYLRQQGVTVDQTELRKCEMLRMSVNWSYPVNHVEPSTGIPTSAVSWSISERADKDRFFSEPGFIVGVRICRPKVYLGNQRAYGASIMTDAFKWLPRSLAEDAESSLAKISNSDGFYSGLTAPVIVDVRDLLLYGDQFVAPSFTATDAGIIALPTSTAQKKYPSAAMVEALFTGTKYDVREDGVAKFTIAGTVHDTSIET